MVNMSQTTGLPPPTTDEKRWIAGWAVMILVVTSLPYLVAYQTQSDLWIFSGFIFGVEDGNSYIAKMLSGSAGAWLFRTPYSTSEQSGVLAFFPYILLGKLTAGPGQHEQLVALFHIYRVFAGMLMILATYDFISCFISNITLRRFGTMMASLGGGLGWILILSGRDDWLGSLPLEFYSPETFGFLSIFGIPHLALARAGMLWSCALYLRAIGESGLPAIRKTLLAGVFWLITALAQPLTALILGFILAVFLTAWILFLVIIKKIAERAEWVKAIRLAVIAGIVPAPFLIYNAYRFAFDPFLIQWTGQNIILSPHPLHYVIAYSLVIPFALAGVWIGLKKRAIGLLLPTVWLSSFPFLVYLPVNLQRRLPEGAWVAMIVLALVYLGTQFQPRFGVVAKLGMVVMSLAFPSTLFLLAGAISRAIQPAPPVFLPVKLVHAFNFMANNTLAQEIVLADYSSSNALPAYAPLRVVTGHGPETVGLAQIEPKLREFFNPNTADRQRLDFLANFRVDYVFWGEAEKVLGGWVPSLAPYLESVYTQDGVIIFRVEP
jgi:hypothetical protein